MSYWKKYNYSKNQNLNKSFSKYQNNNNNYSTTYNRNYYKNRSRSRDSNRKEENYRNQKYIKDNSPSKDSYSESKSDDNSSYRVDRAKTCPFLLRVFYKKNDYNELKLFREEEFPSELNIYTWEDANLEEMAKLIYSELKNSSVGKYVIYKFSSVFYDTKGRLNRKYFGSVDIKNEHSKFNKNTKTTLKKFGFNIGDYIDVAITSPDTK